MPNIFNYSRVNHFVNTFKMLYYLKNGKCCCNRNNTFIIFEYNYISTSGKNYTLCLNYEKYWPPRIWIVKPDLTKGYIPHSYHEHSNRLCLYHHRDFKWTSDENIVQTILCWALLWIEYYEIYEILGKWMGPEVAHMSTPKQPDDTSKITYTEESKNKVALPKYLKNYPILISNWREMK